METMPEATEPGQARAEQHRAKHFVKESGSKRMSESISQLRNANLQLVAQVWAVATARCRMKMAPLTLIAGPVAGHGNKSCSTGQPRGYGIRNTERGGGHGKA